MKIDELYHGSASRIHGELIPHIPEVPGNKKEDMYNAVYATDNKEIAIAKAILKSRGVFSSELTHQNPYGIIYRGKPDQIVVYLYYLNPDSFERQEGNLIGQWFSTKPVFPIKVEEISIEEYSDLVRYATENEKSEWIRRYGKI